MKSLCLRNFDHFLTDRQTKTIQFANSFKAVGSRFYEFDKTLGPGQAHMLHLIIRFFGFENNCYYISVGTANDRVSRSCFFPIHMNLDNGFGAVMSFKVCITF